MKSKHENKAIRTVLDVEMKDLRKWYLMYAVFKEMAKSQCALKEFVNRFGYSNNQIVELEIFWNQHFRCDGSVREEPAMRGMNMARDLVWYDINFFAKEPWDGESFVTEIERDPEMAKVIRKLWTDSAFAKNIAAFLGFAASCGRDSWYRAEPSTLVNKFNDEAAKMDCGMVAEDEVRCIVELVQDYVYLCDDMESTNADLQPVLVMYSVLNSCSFWGPGISFADVLTQLPKDFRLIPEALVWCSSHDAQVEIAEQILKKLEDGPYHHLYVDVLMALVIYSEPLPDDLLDGILNYLFHVDPERSIFKDNAGPSVWQSRHMAEAVSKKGASWLKKTLG